MDAQQMRETYVDFFKERGHAYIRSAPLIPENDPTVLFTTAGMHPLVPYLLGERHPAGNRLTDFQKCVRTGDIDEVGDASHLTFFEMLGNWSLGDYFKKESIGWSYEFLTSVLGMDPNHLAVTAFAGEGDIPRDDETAQIWKSHGMRDDQIEDAERIRDYGLYVAYSNWSYLKNNERYRDEYAKARLSWVSFIAGKRESRRLVGDYVLKEQDLKDFIIHEDGTVSTSWYIDNHEPDPENSRLFPGREYLSRGQLTPLGFYPIPFRCFCSKDIDNMMMAGRNISVSHIALGTVRVMRTTAMMGEVVGLAASICCRNNMLPRDIHQTGFEKLRRLMTQGAGNTNMPYLQVYTLIDTTAARSEDC